MKHVGTILLAALLAALTSWAVASSFAPSERGPAAATSDPRTAELEERLARLEEDAARPAAERVDLVPARAPRPTDSPVDTDRLDLLEERLAELERAFSDGRNRPAPTRGDLQIEDPVATAVRAEAERQRRAQVQANASSIILDATTTDGEKLAAHQTLRRVEDAYTPAMVAELVRLGLESDVPRYRADTWRFFDGSSRLPELVPHLRTAVNTDPEPNVREEAAETLGEYLDEAGVVELLEWLRDNDPDPEVRDEARRALSGQ